MKLKRIAAAALVAGVLLALLAGTALAAPPWSDAPDSYWTTNYGVTDTEVGTVADGYEDNTFRPALAVNRGQFAKMAVSGLDLAPVDALVPTFLDVAKGSTFYTFVEGAYEEGLVTGYPVTGGLEYRPLNNIQRQQANSILGRYLSDAEIAASGVIHGTGGLTYGSLALWYAAQGAFYLNGFDDGGSVAAVHRPATAYLVYRGVVQGSAGMLNPLATLTRSQAAVMILRVADKAAEITTAPPAPINLSVIPASPGKDTTPIVTGQTIPGGIVHIYDSVSGAPVDLFAAVPDNLAPRADVSGAFTANIPTLTDGNHVFTAKVKNASGILSPLSTSSAPYMLDTVAPTGDITAPAIQGEEDDAAVDSAKPTFRVVAEDERSGVEEVELQIALDETTPDWVTVDIDDEAATGGVYQAVWPSTGDLGSGLDDGQYLFRAIVRDNAGNSATLDPTPVTVDTKVPTVAIAEGSLKPVAADGIFYTADRKPEFGAVASDVTGGAAGTDPSGIVKVDFLYAPLTPAPDEWADFTLISSDPGTSGFAVYPPAGMPDGRYLFAVRATDRAGNQSLLMTGSPAAYVAGVTEEVVIDNVDPQGNITAPAAGFVMQAQPTFTAGASDATAGVKQVAFEYATSGAPTTWLPVSTDDTAPYQAAWGATSLVDGSTYHLRAVVTDKSGRISNTASVIITVDLTAPTASITAPADEATVDTGQPTFTAGAADAGGSGVKQVVFQYATSAAPTTWHSISTDTTDPYAAVWGATSLADGDYLLRAIVTDNAGNTFDITAIDITVSISS